MKDLDRLDRNGLIRRCIQLQSRLDQAKAAAAEYLREAFLACRDWDALKDRLIASLESQARGAQRHLQTMRELRDARRQIEHLEHLVAALSRRPHKRRRGR